ncbi:MAG: hypothetical protein K8I27_06830 [Planctomycetes bacterium]|nr:hypothetical protein [Planctomycetota bacterium]
MKTAMIALVGVGGLLACVDGSVSLTAQESSVDVIKEQLRYDEWLDESHAPTGFEFKQEDYDVLDSMEVSKDKTLVKHVQWDVAGNDYVSSISREVTFSDDDSTLGITITVMPSAPRAKESLLLPFEQSSTMPAKVHFAGDFGFTIGAAALFFGIDDDVESVEASEIKSLKFVRYNIVVEMVASEKATLLLTELAYSVDSKIQTQADSEGGALRPEVSLALGSDSVETSGSATGTLFYVDVKHSVSGFPDGTTYGKHFFTGSKSSTGYDTKGRTVASTELEYFGATSALEFDDKETPTKVSVLGSGSRGSYKVGLVAWGPNLLPKIVSESFEVE